MNTPRLSRRAVLRGAGGLAIGLPLLEAMETRAAAGSVFPKRLLLVFTPNGTVKWWPGGWNNNPDPPMQYPGGGRPTGTGTLTNLSQVLAPLEAHKSELLVIGGLDQNASRRGLGHDGIYTVLTGTTRSPADISANRATGPSIDQFLAKSVGRETPFASLVQGVNSFQYGYKERSWVSWAGPAQPITPEQDPWSTFDRLFSASGPTANGNAEANAAYRAKLRARRSSVLGAVAADITDLSKRLGAEDRMRLDAHLTSIRAIERKLDHLTQSTASAATCARPSLGAPITALNDHNNHPALGKIQMDLIVRALACDLTRMALLQWQGGFGNVVMSWLGQTKGHHDLSHGSHGSNDDKLALIQHWYSQQFAYLLGELKKVDELSPVSKTLLDNTVAAWLQDQSVGWTHSTYNIPVVLAGSCGGHFKTGRYVAYNGNSMNDLLVSLCNAMGSTVTSYGDASLCKGPLAGLT